MKQRQPHPLRKRVQIDCSEPKLTDQSDLKSSDINHIMQNYAKTGVLPHFPEKVAKYIDNTKVMPLEQAHAEIQRAKELFYELPSKIRKLMDNDPTKLESFINDAENHDLLIKHGILKKKLKVENSSEGKDFGSPSAEKPKAKGEKNE